MASVITAAEERLGCQEIQIWGPMIRIGDRIRFPWERNDESKGRLGTTSILGKVKIPFHNLLKLSGRRGSKVSQRTE